MVQLLVDCVWDPNARDIVLESYAPQFLQIVLRETNRSIINSYHAHCDIPSWCPDFENHISQSTKLFSCRVRVISWIVPAEGKNYTKPTKVQLLARVIDCPGYQWSRPLAPQARFSVNATGLCTSAKVPLAERVMARVRVLSTAFQQILWKSKIDFAEVFVRV
ncbi:MAG TPA: hypothetical protein VK557_02565 [Pyrinomonadaceae bacterium]|nr:hypothetical protein [Pyrinomonadaceae bacterium]